MDESVMLLDLSDLDTKRRLMTHVGSLKGLYEVTIKQRKNRRSLNQNAYYFQCFVTPFLAWLHETDGDRSITKEQAHITLKAAVLGMKVITNKETGETIEIPPPTKNMKTDEFSIYLDAAAKWLAEFCGIVVLPSEMFFEDRAKAQGSPK